MNATEQDLLKQPPRPSMPGWGVDLRPEDRPGVPKELTPPRPMGHPHWTEPEQQTIGPVAARAAHRRVTPVYGTACPPRGLSGIVRRLAYRIPEYRPRRWMLLMIADRLDAVEHNVVPMAVLLGSIAVTALLLRRRSGFLRRALRA